MSFVPSGSWKVHIDAGATSGAADKVRGHLDDVALRVYYAANPNVGDLSATGRVRFVFDEATQTLSILEPDDASGSLRVGQPVKGFFGKIKPGDAMGWKGTLKVTSPDGPIRIG